MFHPQPTTYASFASYGAPNDQGPDQDQGAYNFQPAGLGLESGGPIVFDSPVFSPAANFGSLPLNVNQNRYGAMNTPPPDDLVAQEVLARTYQPESKGPLVGEKRSSQAIAEEYAKADPIYVTKTSSLPQRYSHYRPVKGDGNCGWRAVGFSYFETLLKLGDKKLLESECERMMSLTEFVVTMCGHEVWIFEDMRDECLNLLRGIQNVIHSGPQTDPSSLILQRFNNPEISDGIVYWLRLLASAFVKSHSDTYEDFIPDLIGVDNYCKDILEPTNNEIEHLGMTLLIEVLLKPIGFAVEIAYLDRSAGTEVTTHFFEPDNPNAAGSRIYLLYRPGHYDILYKEMDISRSHSVSQQQILEHAAGNSNVLINRATNFTHEHTIQGTPADYPGDVSILARMPTIFGPLSTGPLPSSQPFHEPFASIYSPTPNSAPSYSHDSSARTNHSISPVSSVSPTPSIFPPSSLPIHSHPHSMSNDVVSQSAPRVSQQGASQFRPSMYQYKDWGDGPTQGFQTSTFKNSHYNVSHYNNPNFQPEQWTPECDEAVGRIAVGKFSRHKTA